MTKRHTRRARIKSLADELEDGLVAAIDVARLLTLEEIYIRVTSSDGVDPGEDGAEEGAEATLPVSAVFDDRGADEPPRFSQEYDR